MIFGEFNSRWEVLTTWARSSKKKWKMRYVGQPPSSLGTKIDISNMWRLAGGKSSFSFLLSTFTAITCSLLLTLRWAMKRSSLHKCEACERDIVNRAGLSRLAKCKKSDCPPNLHNTSSIAWPTWIPLYAMSKRLVIQMFLPSGYPRVYCCMYIYIYIIYICVCVCVYIWL